MKLHHHAKIMYRSDRELTLHVPQFHMFSAFKERAQGIS